MASKCNKCGNTENYNFELNIGMCNICIGEELERIKELGRRIEVIKKNRNELFDETVQQAEQIKELEGTKTFETKIICGLVDCLQRNKRGECGHATIHLQPCSDSANVAACLEFTE